jgi:hypothetical protein
MKARPGKKPFRGAQRAPKDGEDTDQNQEDLTVGEILLASLYFPTMEKRAQEIESAHTETFEWILQPPGEHSKWSDFPQWLSESNGIYWINGKAASGKSTLMRFICDHRQTTTLLNEWSGPKKLVRATHFFWNSGTSDQRSYAGLLRGLLYGILLQLRNLIRVTFPDKWALAARQERKNRKSGVSREIALVWTLPELIKAFESLIIQASDELRFCLFVDGLDEYEGDPLDIIDLLTRISKFPHVKMCLSSRPLYDFVRSFRSFPTLRLQDLNFDDIKQFVNDTLGRNDQMQELQRKEPEHAPALSQEIIEKADGVFLWVRLVVHSLLRGLRNSDHISDLQRRLRLLPPSLEDLFSHILGRLEPVYLEQSSRIFQIFAASQLSDAVFTSLELSFAEERDAQSLLSSRTDLLLHTERISRIELVDIWLLTRCGGLIETHKASNGYGANRVLSYLHRTVRDFLELPQVWSRVLDATRGSDFNPFISLLQSTVLFIRFTLNPCGRHVNSRVELNKYITKCLEHAYLADEKMNQATSLLLDELGRDILHETHSRLPCCHSGDRTLLRDQEYEHEFLTIAVSNGLYHYVAQKLEREPDIVRKKTGRPLLLYAVDGVDVDHAVDGRFGKFRQSSKMVDLLLRHGARVKQVYEGDSAREHVLLKLGISSSGRGPLLEEYSPLELLKTINASLWRTVAWICNK